MLSLLFLVAGTTVAEGGSGVQTKVSMLAANTLVDTTISDRVGSCRISLVRPALRKGMYLHLTLNGCGTRYVTRQSVSILADIMDAHKSEGVTCVVRMSESRGASLLALPVVAQFLLTHRKQLHRVSVLEARGLALNAVRTVMRLNNRCPHINVYHSWSEFESACKASKDERDQFALGLEVRQYSRRRTRWSRAGNWLDWASKRLKQATDVPAAQERMQRRRRSLEAAEGK